MGSSFPNFWSLEKDPNCQSPKINPSSPILNWSQKPNSENTIVDPKMPASKIDPKSHIFEKNPKFNIQKIDPKFLILKIDSNF